MTAITSLDLESLISNAMKEVFQTMLSMEVKATAATTNTSTASSHIVGSVSFAGSVMGNININVNEDFARLMTASMLDMKVDSINDDEAVYDVIGELCNMIGGDLKSRLCDTGLTCQLSIPSVTRGKDFTVESKNWLRKEQLGFKYQEHIALVEVYMKVSK